MKHYDSIDYYGDHFGIPTIAFDKLDGSNIRAEFTRKRGFYKFGSRNVLIDGSHEQFGFAIDLFLNKYNEGLSRIFTSKDYRDIQSFVCFAELIGKKSAFGQHEFGNDEFDIVLFDVDQYKKGFVQPREFVKRFQLLGIPKIVHDGNLNMEFVNEVKQNVYGLQEGVICKSVISTKKGSDRLHYSKIKTNDWFARLRGKDPELYELELKQSKGK